MDFSFIKQANYRRGFFRMWIVLAISWTLISSGISARYITKLPWYDQAEDLIFKEGTPYFVQADKYDSEALPPEIKTIIDSDLVQQRRYKHHRDIMLAGIIPPVVMSVFILVFVMILFWVGRGFKPRQAHTEET